MEFYVAKQCFFASISVPIKKLWKELAVKVVKHRSIALINGPNYFRF